jgi:hypothetical protein
MNTQWMSKKVAAWLHGCMVEMKHICLIGTDPRRIDNCMEGSDSTRDGEHEKGVHSISIGIGVAFIVCISVNCRSMSTSIHQAKH